MSGSAKRRGRYERRLPEAEIAQPHSTSSPATHVEAPDSSDMDRSPLLQLVFSDTALGTVRATQAGRWEADLAFLMSDQAEASTYLESTALNDLDKRFSISTYLSSAGVSQVAPSIILHHGEPIDGGLLVCLAMNEECRKKGRGVFYHLPLRQNQEVGHACDLVFRPKKWEREQKYQWDIASWAQRLDQYRIHPSCYDKIDSSDLVIPICSRILRFSEEPATCKPATAADPLQEIPKRPLPNYASDPSVVENAYHYSRPLQDLSTYLILYPSLHTPPLTCATGVFEDKAHCDRQPTQSDMSETFMLKVKCDAAELHGKVAKAMYEKSRKRYLAASKPISSNAEVVECLLRAWNEEDLNRHTVEMTDNGDKVRYFWQELKNMMDTGPETRELAATWPKK